MDSSELMPLITSHIIRITFSSQSSHVITGAMVHVLKHVLVRALESQRTKGDCREAMKTIFND
jgi:hypothetical protein